RGEHPMPARRAQQQRHSARVVWRRGTGARQLVRLVQRAADASLMAGMWELPVYEPKSAEAPEFTVRHAITVTNHVVDVYLRSGGGRGVEGEWVPARELSERPLTGLARKILRRLGCLP
ncbi:MAG TPA: A/G-specific adenine glycosylase, partial [Acidobacteriaceae bacterium]|nr:A/G-specific adenine glycosylase [Acidobacteriaceae bacterium]